MNQPASRHAYDSASLGEHLQKGFDAYMRQWQAWIVPSLVFFILVLATSCVLFLSIGPLTCGMYYLAFCCLKNKPVDLNGLSRGRDVLGSAMAAGGVMFLIQLGPVLVLYGMMIAAMVLISGPGQEPSPIAALFAVGLFGIAMVGFMAFSLWISTKTMFVFPLIADRGLDFKSAFRESFAATKEGFWWLMLTHFVANLIGQLGSSFCGVGALFTMPLYFTIMAGAYDERFGIQSVAGDEAITAEIVPSTPGIPPARPPRETGNPYQS